MKDSYGRNLKIKIFGGSHDPEIGLLLAGFPAGMKIDYQALADLLKRRAPGQNKLTTARRESDEPIFLSGIDRDGMTNGGEIKAIIKNTNQNSAVYSKTPNIPRPSHADYAALVKYRGRVDLRGGGHFSGRLTAPLCIAGALCRQYLKENYGISIGAHIYQIGGIKDRSFDLAQIDADTLDNLPKKSMAVLDEQKGRLMQEKIAAVQSAGDSVGGIIECAAVNVPIGWGEHMFWGAENRIAALCFAVPAVKGIEFGLGFGSAALRDSENNDAFYTDGKRVYTKTNNCGGLLGGMTDGMPVVFRAAIKPTPSIFLAQDSVDLTKMENVRLQIEGRHAPCIVLRAVPIMESVMAIALMDMLLDEAV